MYYFEMLKLSRKRNLHENQWGKILKVFFNGFWQYFKPTTANFYAIGQIFTVVNGQILKNSLAIWSTQILISVKHLIFLSLSC